MTQKDLTQNRLCRSTGSCAYALCKFSAAVATSVSWPMKPLANWPAAWATAPWKKSVFLSWRLRKNLPRIVVVFPRACFQLVIELHHQEGLWQHYQPRGPMHPLKNQFLVYDLWEKSHPESSFSFLRHVFRLFSWWVSFVTDVMVDGGMSSMGSQLTLNKFETDHFSVVGWPIKNLTQNRRCRCSGIAAYSLCKSAAFGEESPMKPLAKLPAAWANAPFKINFSFMTHKKILTQNRFWRSTDKALYALCQFSVFSPRRPLATLPAAWANAPYKNQFSRSWLFKKILPRIVFVFPQAYFQIDPLVSQIRHRRND